VPFTTATWGTDLQDQNIYSGNDTINGNAYNNSLKGYGGNDRIDGGAGTDTVYFTGLKAQYQITKSGNTMTVSGPDGSDTLLNVERLQFGDKAIAYDTGGIGGQVYRLYQAAFARQPDSPTARQPDSPIPVASAFGLIRWITAKAWSRCRLNFSNPRSFSFATGRMYRRTSSSRCYIKTHCTAARMAAAWLHGRWRAIPRSGSGWF
jgi:hypothetical protein